MPIKYRPLCRAFGARHGVVSLLGVVAVVFVLTAFGAPARSNEGFSFSSVIDVARDRAARPFEAPPEVPAVLRDLSYEDYQNLRFRSEEALWRGQGLFEVQFFHTGFIFHHPVEIHAVENGRITPVEFRPEMFDLSRVSLGEVPPVKPGFAGFRLHFPLHRPDYKDEVAVFLGASFFRFLGRGQQYGLTARGVAIDTALPQAEETPSFRAFWLEKPAPDATSMTIYALLDGPSTTGAYRFVVTPDMETVIDVSAVLFLRRGVDKLGLAPLNSMFLKGENSRRRFDDFRPEVHDSDALLIHTGEDEWIFRPLDNPSRLRVSAFLDTDPKGFGLVQRDREFDHYLDLDQRFEKRPSVWVEPGAGWGRGHIELVEIPSGASVNDNVIAYWVPEKAPAVGRPLRLDYRLTSKLDSPAPDGLARAILTRIGSARVQGDGGRMPNSARLFVVDFAGETINGLSPAQPLRPVYSVTGGSAYDVNIVKREGASGWRVSFRLQPAADRPSDMKLHLELRGKRVSETWSYIFSPQEGA